MNDFAEVCLSVRERLTAFAIGYRDLVDNMSRLRNDDEAFRFVNTIFQENPYLSELYYNNFYESRKRDCE